MKYCHPVLQFVLLIFPFSLSPAQSTSSSAEDSLTMSQLTSSSTTIGGYGNAVYSHDVNQKTSLADLERVVLFVGHKFNASTTFFSELEMEDAKVSGGEDGGEIAFEQAYVKFDIDPDHYFTAGLFLPRIGILNENHLPTTFNGNERTQVETYILPSTWRELGIGFYGTMSGMPLNYSIALVNGLNSSTFEHGSGIREGRFEGRNASANNLALTGALQLREGDWKFQVAGYYGGTVAASPQAADTLQLSSGIFGTPVAIGEADFQYEHEGLTARALGTIVSIPDAFEINRAYGNNTPSREYGTYIELAYNVFQGCEQLRGKQLNVFARYERLDMNASIPSNGVTDGTLDQHHLIVGISYLPINDIVLKADVRWLKAGDQNPALATGNPAESPYDATNTFFSLGIGFSY